MEASLSGPAFSAPYKVSNKASCSKKLTQLVMANGSALASLA